MSIIDSKPKTVDQIATEIRTRIDLRAANAVRNGGTDVDESIDEISRELKELDPNLQHDVMKKLMEGWDSRRRLQAIKAFENQRDRVDNQIRDQKDRSVALNKAVKWFEDIAPIYAELNDAPLPIERNEHSRLHHFKEAIRDHRLINTVGTIEVPNEYAETLIHTFVVKHDWARAFEHAEGLPTEIILPYDLCVFELRILGRTVLAIFTQVPDVEDNQVEFSGFVQCDDFWITLAPGKESKNPVLYTIYKQVLAICVALEAQVAIFTKEAAPAKLNAKRARDGKIPLADFHIVDLASRYKTSKKAPAGGPSGYTGIRQRMHFRRGYERFMPRYKKVKWYIAGDPDLGFIHKEYSL